MLGVEQLYDILLRKGWPSRVRSAVNQIIFLARIARRITASWSRTCPARHRSVSLVYYTGPCSF